MRTSIIPSSNVRPLGEEHLRMFRRTVKDQTEDQPKVVLPKEVGNPFVLSTGKIAFIDIRKVVELEKEYGSKLATLDDVLSNQHGLIRLKNVCIWINCKDIPMKVGLYRIANTHLSTKPMTIEQIGELKWYEKLEITQSAISAAGAGHPVAIYAGKLKDDDKQLGLVLSGVCSDMEGAPLALTVS